MGDDEQHRSALLNEALTWSAIVGLQRERLRDTEEWIAAEHAEGRHVVGVDDDSRQTFVRLRADRHFLIVAARNLLRAIGALELPDPTGISWADHVLVLRNCLEHWDEPDGPSAKKFLRLFPEGAPTSFRFGPAGSHVGELNVDSLNEAVRHLRERLLGMERDGWVWKPT